MQKPVKHIKDTVGNIVKPVAGLVDGFNTLMKKLEEKTAESGKSGVEIDGFVNILLDEMKDAEQGIFAFFTEMLFMHHLSEKMAQVENEVTLVSILAERIKEFLKPAFIEAFLCGVEKTSLHLAYHFPSEQEFNPANVRDIAAESFSSGESRIFNGRMIGVTNYSVLTAPLRTTGDRFGALVVGKKGRNSFSSEEITLVIAGAAVVSFSISNTKLVNSIIKNERLVTIGETIGGLSHDIKNILNSLECGIAVMDIALENANNRLRKEGCLCPGCGGSDSCREDFEMLVEGSQGVKNGYERMKNLVLSMVDYSREREISVSPVNLNTLVESVLTGMKDRLQAGDIMIIREFDEKMPDVPVDPDRIARMLFNLLHNALDAVREKRGIIRVGTSFSEEESVAGLWVADNGGGINEENREKIFDVFYSSKGSKGTGFGLAIVQKVVREHGGTITVESAVGKGAKFLVKIPVTKT